MAPNEEIKVPLEPWMEIIAERAATRALEKHTDTCQIRHVCKDIYGNGDGRPGLKLRVHDLEKAQGLARKLGMPAIVAVVTAIALKLLGVIGLR